MGNLSEEWVPFASMLTFELFKDRNDGGRYVRVKLNDRVLQVPTCEIPGKHHAKMGSTMCTFDAFMEHVKPVLATADDYKNECGKFPENFK
ncbi:hypothetical protein FBU59_005468 [Linderina macrospora]|uniref:Uncharacterized protein n=1 Tax=Linderina macrospora TaxID=4868 RepID=A0ACC1J2R0_9FUNG|nr:hypothetical protein FBU59_005468 [Linderina macrospora]